MASQFDLLTCFAGDGLGYGRVCFLQDFSAGVRIGSLTVSGDKSPPMSTPVERMTDVIVQRENHSA
jgi:hypothetical protein